MVKQTDRWVGIQTYGLADRQMGRQINKWACRQADGQADRQPDIPDDSYRVSTSMMWQYDNILAKSLLIGDPAHYLSNGN